MILLNTFWGIVFFEGLDYGKKIHIAAVPVAHLLVSCLVSIIEQFRYFRSFLTCGFHTQVH